MIAGVDGPGPALVFRDDDRVDIDGETVILTGPGTALTLRPVRAGVRDALSRLAVGPVPVAELFDGLSPAERPKLGRVLDRAGAMLAHSVLSGRCELLRLERTGRDTSHPIIDVAVDTPVRMSRFAFLRTRADTLVLESPLATFRVLLVHRATRELVAGLGTTRTPGELAGGELALDEVLSVLGRLTGAGFIELGDAGRRFPSEVEPTLRQWDFHDLLFHSRIRSGRYDDTFGAVYPYTGQIPPRPAVKTPPTGPGVSLSRPDLDDLLARDPALTTAIETRRSIRQYGDVPLTVDQLGEFLYRVGRVRAHFVPGDGTGDEVVSRPYPSGGGAYDLELYLSVRRCIGLVPGIYSYDPVAHRLILVNDDVLDRHSMFNVAGRATGMPDRPDVLITMTSRFQRLSWKYRAIAYATTLRHTGVLYQTMYLVATAMGLAPCGLGNGDADMAARVLGLDYLVESSVGDFLLGTRRPDESVVGAPEPGWRMLNDPDWALGTDRERP